MRARTVAPQRYGVSLVVEAAGLVAERMVFLMAKLYRIKWRGYSGRTHKLKGKYRMLKDGTFVDKKGFGLPRAIQYHIVKVKKAS